LITFNFCVHLQVPVEFKEVLDDTAVAALSNSSPLVRYDIFVIFFPVE